MCVIVCVVALLVWLMFIVVVFHSGICNDIDVCGDINIVKIFLYGVVDVCGVMFCVGCQYHCKYACGCS